MLVTVEPSGLVYSELPEKLVPIILDIEHRIARGEKIAIKKKTTKSGVYMNIYIYDKTCWKYLLSQSIKMD